MQKGPIFAECSVFHMSGCFGDNDASMTPFIASLWYGIVASAEAAGPVLLYYMLMQNTVNSV